MSDFKRNLPLLLLVVFSGAQAQPLPGYNTGRYAGIAGIELQPASAAHDLYKLDILFLGAEAGFNNNYVSIKRKAIFNREEWSNNNVNFRKNYTRDNYNNKVKHLFLWSKVYLPSVLFMPTQRLGLAYNWGSRGAVQIRNADPHLAKLAYEELEYEELWGQRISNPNLNLHAVKWQEHSLSFGYKIKNEGAHRWKAGGSVKLIKGINALYMHARTLELTAHNGTDLEFYEADFAFAASQNFAPSDFFMQSAAGKLTMGLGAGIIYQYNPPSLKIEEKWKSSVKQELDKYKLQAGISIVDVGTVLFDGEPTIGDFNTASTEWNIDRAGFSSLQQFSDTLKHYFTMHPGNGEVKIRLPAAVNFSIDYHLYNSFFVHLNHYQSIINGKNSNTLKAITTTTLTPRFENDAIGAFLPISVSEQGNIKAGMAFRVGPLVIGTSDVNNLLVKKYFRAADVFVLLKWGLLWSKVRPRDLCPSDPEMM